MTAPIAISGDDIAFTLKFCKPNTLPFTVPLSYLYTNYGFFIPMSNGAFEFFEYIKMGVPDVEQYEALLRRGILISADGFVREVEFGVMVYSDDKRRYIFNKLIIPVHPEFKYVRSIDLADEESMTMAIEVAPDLPSALEIYSKTRICHTDGYVFMKISEIVKELIATGRKSSLFYKDKENLKK